MSDLVRFSVTMPEDLMQALDEYAERRGKTKNRSEAIRDMIRETIVAETVEDPESMVFGKLDSIQHENIDEIVSAVHVHLDHQNCLEVILMKGQSKTIHRIADELLGAKGVFNGKLVVTTMGKPEDHDHPHPHSHPHPHPHA